MHIHSSLCLQPTLLNEDLEREGVDAAIAVVKARATSIAETAFWDSITARLKAGLKVGGLMLASFCVAEVAFWTASPPV
jgi:hypothetical protein